MFMLTFSVLTISIVGLFFQVINALTAYFLSLQLSLGEQMLKWHSLAYQYTCTVAGLAKPDDYVVTFSDLGTTRSTEIAGGYQWKTIIFRGTYGSTPNTRLLVTYVLPTDKPGGFAPTDVARQVLKLTTKRHYRLSRVNAGSVTFTTFSHGESATPISVSGLPSVVANNSVVLVGSACE